MSVLQLFSKRRLETLRKLWAGNSVKVECMKNKEFNAYRRALEPLGNGNRVAKMLIEFMDDCLKSERESFVRDLQLTVDVLAFVEADAKPKYKPSEFKDGVR